VIKDRKKVIGPRLLRKMLNDLGLAKDLHGVRSIRCPLLNEGPGGIGLVDQLLHWPILCGGHARYQEKENTEKESHGLTA